MSLAVEQTKTLQSWKIAQETDRRQLDEMVKRQLEIHEAVNENRKTLKNIEHFLETGQKIKPESKGT